MKDFVKDFVEEYKIWKETTLKNITGNERKLTPSAGVRPIYLPPEEQTYSVTVLLDGEVENGDDTEYTFVVPESE